MGIFKVYCKEDIIDINQNFFKIKGAGYGETYIRWKKGVAYEARLGNEQELSVGSFIYIEHEVGSYSPLKKKFFYDNFETIEDKRNRIIEELIK